MSHFPLLSVSSAKSSKRRYSCAITGKVLLRSFTVSFGGLADCDTSQVTYKPVGDRLIGKVIPKHTFPT